MKKLILIAALALYVTAGCATVADKQQQKLVVAPFENRSSKLDAAALNNLQDSLINAFINTGRFQVPDRTALNLLAAEQKFQLSDWSDDAKSAQMGKVLNADYIVRVITSYDGEVNLLMARVLDVNTANGLSAAEMEFNTQRDARGKMDDFVGKIIQRISGGGTPPPAAAANTNAGRTGGQAPAGFVHVQGGSFQMGSNNGESDEKPVHSVTVSGFYMGIYEVTQKEWVPVMGSNPSYRKGNNLPVELVSWDDAIEYCNKRSQREGLTQVYGGSASTGITCNFKANGYRLPTEAEWEYAAKGGNKGGLITEYSGSNNVGAVAWYDGNSGSTTHLVGQKAANALGLYDMSGNVWEWCWDWYGGYGSGSQTDPTGLSSGSSRVLRGGSWGPSAFARSAGRGSDTPALRHVSIGFRLVRSEF